MSRKQSAKDILKTIGQDSSYQSKSSTTPKPSSTSTHRTHKLVRCYCLKYKDKLVNSHTKEQYSLTTS